MNKEANAKLENISRHRRGTQAHQDFAHKIIPAGMDRVYRLEIAFCDQVATVILR